VIETEDIGGTHIKYLYRCRRQLWLFLRACDLTYDSVIVYTFPPGTTPQRLAWGNTEPEPTDIL
jgi:hypothetical protein